MARARNIKPGFFKNEDLGTADPFVSLLFAGLWTLADKAGILEDRPLRIKAELFPYRDNFDINGYLTVLVSFGFIHRYEVDGLKLIQIAKFKEHQNPHHTEKDSIFPSYLDSCKLTVKEPLHTSEAPADSLIPDSLNTDSLIPDVGAEKSAPSTRGKQLPKDWVLPRAWGEWALEERPELTPALIRKEADKFKDHWLANANQRNGKKSDWLAAWRNWIRGARIQSQAPPQKQTIHDKRSATAQAMFGGLEDGNRRIIDVSPSSPTEGNRPPLLEDGELVR